MSQQVSGVVGNLPAVAIDMPPGSDPEPAPSQEDLNVEAREVQSTPYVV